MVLYPERFRWSDPQEAVFDWLMSDMYSQFKMWNALNDEWFDSIGIACSSHKAFEQFCVVEFGKNVKPMHSSILDNQEWDEELDTILEDIKLSKFLEIHTNRDLVDENEFLSPNFKWDDVYENIPFPDWWTDD